MIFLLYVSVCFIYLFGALGVCGLLFALFDYVGEDHDIICIIAAWAWPASVIIFLIILLLDLLCKGVKKLWNMIIKK